MIGLPLVIGSSVIVRDIRIVCVGCVGVYCVGMCVCVCVCVSVRMFVSVYVCVGEFVYMWLETLREDS